MNKIVLNRKKVILVAFLGIVFSLLLLDELAIKYVSIGFVVIATTAMAWKLEKTGKLSLLSSAGPLLLAATEKYLSDTVPVSNFVVGINAVLNWLGTSAQIDGKTGYTLLFYVLFALVLLVLSLPDNTGMGTFRGKVDKEQAQQAQAFCNTLRDRIVSLNRDADWNASNFVPLEAQVEMTINGKKKRKSTDLLNCLKRNRTFFTFRKIWDSIRRKPDKTVFLVLGDPGAGKSVALRKLCLDLLDEAKLTKKIPVYVNLRKWSRDWTVSNPPTRQDLIDFIENTLRGESRDTFSDSFLDNYFSQMLNEGRWYFLFDSFDELPCLMGSGNNREMIGILSALLHDFLVSGNQNGGVIASRLYKAPSKALEAEVTLNIREFDDMRIKTMLHQRLKGAADVVDKLFQEREDLVTLCRNPFYLSLLISYTQKWGTRFPKNQMELYTQFLDDRLKKSEGMLREEGLSEEDVKTAARELAAFMQASTEYGLECPARMLYRHLGGRVKWQKRLHLLEYARLCRMGGQDATVSFVHRRFQEFFLAENFRDGTIVPDYSDSIRYNSGLRDALVLYCEVAELSKAREIAHFCWTTVQDCVQFMTSMDDVRSLELINTLDFMTDAFRNRREAIAEFETEYEEFVQENLKKDTHFFVQLALANGIALFDQTRDNLPRTVLQVFQLKNRWLNEMVLKNCRLIKKMDDRISTQFTRCFLSQDRGMFLKQFRNTDFALSKAKGFGYVRLIHSTHLIWTILLYILVVLLAVNMALAIHQLSTGETSVSEVEVESVQSKTQEFIEIDIDPLRIKLAFRTKTSKTTIFMVLELTFYLIINLKLSRAHFRTTGKKYLSNQDSKLLLYLLLYIILFASNAIDKNMATIYCTFIIQSIMILLDLPRIIHNIFFALKKINFKIIRKLNLKKFCKKAITAICITLLFALIYFIIHITKKYNSNIIAYLLTGVLGATNLIGLITIAKYALDDRKNSKYFSIPSKISSIELYKNIEAFHSNKWRLAYLNRLLDNKTQVYNEDQGEDKKPGTPRPKFENDEVERAIATLEYESRKAEQLTYSAVP